MAVSIHVTNDPGRKLEYRLCEALVGSPAFVDSEIAVCDDVSNDSAFYLVVGKENERDIELEVDANHLKIDK